MKYNKGVAIVNTWKNLYKYSKKYTIHGICLPLNVHCIDLKIAELLRWPNVNVSPSIGSGPSYCGDAAYEKEV